jgi:acetyl esterase
MIYLYLTRLLLNLPQFFLIWLSGKRQVTTKGNRKLDPGFQFLLNHIGEIDPSKIDLSLPASDIRDILFKAQEPIKALEAPLTKGVSYKDHQVSSEGELIRVREYTNEGLGRNVPALIYFHGGGWVFFNIESHHIFTGFLCKTLNAKVFSVDYRLAPEHPYPAALNDFDAVFDWLELNHEDLGIDPKRISVGGDSAGGNLSACISISRQEKEKSLPKAQLLIYPVTDLTFSSDSIEELAEGFFLTKEVMYWFRDKYLRDHKTIKDPLISPLFAKDLSHQPPAVIITAGFDVLRDEGEAYAKLLKNSGVETYYHEFQGYIHGFVNMEIVKGVNKSIIEFCEDFKKIY